MEEVCVICMCTYACARTPTHPQTHTLTHTLTCIHTGEAAADEAGGDDGRGAGDGEHGAARNASLAPAGMCYSLPSRRAREVIACTLGVQVPEQERTRAARMADRLHTPASCGCCV